MKLFAFCLISALLVATFPTTSGRPFYAELIPNGLQVPHPGSQGGVWAGVGHENAAGGGPRNPFGLDFLNASLTWTLELCQTDSDGDGRSNGEELGDPDCLWMVGGDAPAGPAVSHPGIVDEVNDDGVSLDPCSGYEAPEDLIEVDVNFSQLIEIDETRTHYKCEQLVMPAPMPGSPMYQVRTDALIDNAAIVHHMWVYTCDGATSSDGDRAGQGPYDCSGVETNCQIIAGWAVGPTAWCEPPNVAAYIDWSSDTVLKLEIHYDNSVGSAQADATGMRLGLTPTARALDSGFAILGMDYWDIDFRIPVHQEQAPLSNLCPTAATRRLRQPVWVYAWNPHMHLYGKQLVTEHYRCGRKIGEIGRIEDYEFDNQQSYVLDPPVKILPGDALVTTCTFDTTSATNISSSDGFILGGEETTEEMCDNYLTYFPYVGTLRRPNKFSLCAAYNNGFNPRYYDGRGYQRPVVLFDVGGEIIIRRWRRRVRWNRALCCFGFPSRCERRYRSRQGQPCAVSSDCRFGLTCESNICRR